MAFVVGAIIGALIGAAIVYSYEIKWLNARTKELDDLEHTINTTVAFQEGMIAGLKQQLKMYEAKYGPLVREESSDKEEPVCNSDQ